MLNPDWPKAIEGNQFTLAKCDPDVVPHKIAVTTWSALFSEGGSVTIEAYTEGNGRCELARISRKRGGHVGAERAHLQGLLDEFETDRAGNWRALVQKARASVLAHMCREAEKYDFAVTFTDPKVAP